jgi:hypothetical protein
LLLFIFVAKQIALYISLCIQQSIPNHTLCINAGTFGIIPTNSLPPFNTFVQNVADPLRATAHNKAAIVSAALAN